MNKIGYCIWAPDFVKSSAGIRALYILCDQLNSMGYDSHVVFSSKTPANLSAPLMSLKKASSLAKSGKKIVVYPETVPGNPLDAKYVVRWVLNIPGLLGGTRIYNPNEKVFYYSEVFKPYICNKTEGKLYLPTVEEDIFHNNDVKASERNLTVFYVGKSTFKPGYFEKNKALEITRTFPEKSSLGPIFRQASVFYCFDNSSIICYEAAMCGCPTIIIPDGTQTREDYEKLELGMNGIAWGPEELPSAVESIKNLKPKYDQIKANFGNEIEYCVKSTQEWDDEKIDSYIASLPTDLLETRNQKIKEFQELYFSTSFTLAKNLQGKYPNIIEISFLFAFALKKISFMKKIMYKFIGRK